MAEAGEAIRDALQGRSGRDAQRPADRVPGLRRRPPRPVRATVGEGFTGPDDPLLAATTRVIDSISAALRGYGISDADMVHAIRTVRCTIHGFATLAEAGGFRWSGEPGDTFDYMIGFIDRGLRAEVPTAG